MFGIPIDKEFIIAVVNREIDRILKMADVILSLWTSIQYENFAILIWQLIHNLQCIAKSNLTVGA